MESRRKDWFYDFIMRGSRFFLKVHYGLNVEGEEYIPREGPALVMAKHRRNHDIRAEAYSFLDHTSRRLYWTMKHSLSLFHEWGGGIPVYRSGEVSRNREALLEARAANKNAEDYAVSLLASGEVLIIHPEGTRVRNGMGPIKRSSFSLVERLNQEGVTVPVIPLGIEYTPLPLKRELVTVRFGESRSSNDGSLREEIYRDIARLSGF